MFPDSRYVARYLRPMSRHPLITPCGQHAAPQTVFPVLKVWSEEDWFEFYPKAIKRRMPPVQKLIFLDYDCNQLGQDMEDLWDLSHLRSLRLERFERRNIVEALKDLPAQQLAHLQVLEIEMLASVGEESCQSIIGHLIGRLESLEILMLGLPFHSSIDAFALFKHGGSRLRRVDLDSSCPTVSEMKEIFRYCPQLVDLQFRLDCEDRPMDYDRLLDVLAYAQSLQIVTIHAVAASLNKFYSDTETESTDPTYDAVQHLMTSLHGRRVGIPFKMVTVCVPGCPRTGKVFRSRVNQQGVYQKFGPEMYERRVIMDKQKGEAGESEDIGSIASTVDNALAMDLEAATIS
ncbi:hypothetical protein DL98DRAFT_517286 [Cadophora sp. DSE1049]|nr:hypothetical protein DL98DRAFT_517286 [Cadophora sp. DSE1049]